jgi:hypothetical protein
MIGPDGEFGVVTIDSGPRSCILSFNLRHRQFETTFRAFLTGAGQVAALRRPTSRSFQAGQWCGYIAPGLHSSTGTRFLVSPSCSYSTCSPVKGQTRERARPGKGPKAQLSIRSEYIY